MKYGFNLDLSSEDVKGTISAEVDISAEEMVAFVKASKEADLNALEILRAFGSDVMNAEKAIRQRAKEAGPEWVDIVSEMGSAYCKMEHKFDMLKVEFQVELDKAQKDADLGKGKK